jgi:hypothetical protein
MCSVELHDCFCSFSIAGKGLIFNDVGVIWFSDFLYLGGNEKLC